ncbi:GTPase [Cyanothece sp. BG0011]|uniref:GTPase n=1 Tax=Cyanothece sp. BG0011 TaxID=2082950 RepID=UPI000D1FC514|nr:GTPase [Cyanothece sp. BG0011]
MKIIFVYNANSGFMNTVLDIGHKIISPETYNCNLCNITYGIFKENKEWKTFRESSDYELEFLHKDEFEKKYQQKRDYPIILMSNKNYELYELINKDELNKMQSAEELINQLQATIK